MKKTFLGGLLLAGLAACSHVPQTTRAGPDGLIEVGKSLYVTQADEEDTFYLMLIGPITRDTAFDFKAFVEVVETDGEVNALLIVSSPGGDIQAAHQIGDAIRAGGMNTLVLQDCASACVDVFIAGKTRGMTSEATLAMHAPDDRDFGYMVDDPYWTRLGFGPVNDRVYALEDNQLWVVSADQAMRMRMATELVTPDG